MPKSNGQDLYDVPSVKESSRLLTEPSYLRKEPRYENVQGS